MPGPDNNHSELAVSETGSWLQFRLQSSASAHGRRGVDDAWAYAWASRMGAGGTG